MDLQQPKSSHFSNFTGGGVVMFMSRSDHSQHPVCLSHEDQEGVALLGSPSPPAGQILRRSSCHSANCQHVLHGADGSGSHRLHPLTSLSSISSGKGCVFRACARGGTLLWKNILRNIFSLRVWIQLMFMLGFLSCLRCVYWFFRSLSCTGFLELESLCGTILLSQCSSVSSGLFCSLCSYAQTP